MEESTKPFLRWAGSKLKLLPALASYWRPSHKRYIEPFMGSACLFFHLNPPEALLSDLNLRLVDTFNVIKEHPLAVARAISGLPKGKEAYYQLRSQNLDAMPRVKRAAAFVFLNRYCFNGLYRTNLSGQFNVPYSASRTGELPTLAALKQASGKLKCATLQCLDFEHALANIRPGDFIYLDPPFALANRRMFRQYGPDSFGLGDLERLSACLRAIDRAGATFLVSYALCREGLSVFRQWNVRRITTQRNIAGFAKHRRKAIELLISNSAPSLGR